MISALEGRLKKVGQEQLLQYYHDLNHEEREKLTAQLREIDFEHLSQLIPEYVLQRPKVALPATLDPAPFFPLQPRSAEEAARYAEARKKGAELIGAGKVAALTVAGGQGTRLGYDGPKGTYPIAPISGKPLFQYFAESLRRAGAKFGHRIDWYVMTSQLNDEATRKFFADHDNFGLEADQVFFFTQGTMPAIGYDGKLLMAAKDSLALSPDGHGGTLLALRKSGALDRMKQSGVEYLSYFQVDNPLVPVVDPLFIGMHFLEQSEMSAIMLAKVEPFERVGNFCVSDGRLYVIEYSDLPEELAVSKRADGTLRFIAGSPAIHVISREFVERLTATGRLELVWHRADKKIKHLDENGVLVSPTEPNGVKLESFIFDALPLASRTMILEADRKEEFAPTKNPTGVDSVESCRMMLMERDARRLEAAGVKVPRKADGTLDCRLEISPLAVWDVEDAKAYAQTHDLSNLATRRGESIYLDV